MRYLIFLSIILGYQTSNAQITPYELNGKNYSATYKECITYYQQLAKQYKGISVKKMGNTDANEPLHLVLLSNDAQPNLNTWAMQNKCVLLINNGIHPGEPDGIDASMLLARTICQRIKANKFPKNIGIAIIPVYNIGGMLNRSPYYRVDQDGPEEFGSRGNSQNLDLNRDFIKCDSREAQSFAEIFHSVKPHIFLDNHVSDGADYPYVMTMATTQKDKLGGLLGTYLNETMEPALFQQMARINYPIIPYVNAWGYDARKGWPQFFDSPRYSSGYATLFNTIAFVAETHMLKPYPARVDATYQFMETLINYCSKNSNTLIQLKKQAINNMLAQSAFPISWKNDKTKFDLIDYNGFEYKEKKSIIGNLPVNYYDRNSLYTEKIKFYNQYNADKIASAPTAYLIPQGWHKVINLLKLNKVTMTPLTKDTIIQVEAYTIKEAKSSNTAYEGHHSNRDVQVIAKWRNIKFRKGDVYIPTNQVAKRFLIETLEPHAMDSYFSWNYFDAILIQKEGFTTYAYEPIAAELVTNNKVLADSLKSIAARDTSFAKDLEAQLDYIYKHSPYYEPQHNLYPVYRLVDQSSFINTDGKGTEIRNKVDE